MITQAAVCTSEQKRYLSTGIHLVCPSEPHNLTNVNNSISIQKKGEIRERYCNKLFDISMQIIGALLLHWTRDK